MEPISRATSTSCEQRRRAPLSLQNRSLPSRLRRRTPQLWLPEPATLSASALETRHSHGLDQFCASLVERPGLSILDLAGASQATVTFVTDYGHRLYSDDFLHQLDHCFGDGDFYENQSNPVKVSRFLDAALNFREGQFDGVLVWDTLQFLTAP